MSTDWSKFAGLKITQAIAIVLMLAFITTCAVGLFTNKPIDIWGLRFNITQTVAVHDTVRIVTHDTIRVESATSPTRRGKSSDITQSAKNEVNQNSGNNLGNIGGSNNTVNNTFGKIPSHPNEKLVNDIEKALPDKDSSKA